MKRQRWYPIGTHEIGLECRGEFRMDAVTASIEIRTAEGESIFSAPEERFYIPYWNAQYGAPDTWNNPLFSSEDGRYLYVIWLHKLRSLQSVLLDLQCQGGYRFDSTNTPRKLSFYPDGGEIVLRHNLTPYHEDLLLKNWDIDSNVPVRVFSGGFESYAELFDLQKNRVEQGATSNPYQPSVPSKFTFTSTSFPESDAFPRW